LAKFLEHSFKSKDGVVQEDQNFRLSSLLDIILHPIILTLKLLSCHFKNIHAKIIPCHRVKVPKRTTLYSWKEEPILPKKKNDTKKQVGDAVNQSGRNMCKIKKNDEEGKRNGKKFYCDQSVVFLRGKIFRADCCCVLGGKRT
jgi:hypothetical protein